MPTKKTLTLHVVWNHEHLYHKLMRSDELKNCMDPDEEAIDDKKPIDVQLLAEWLDEEAEGANYHDFVGCHKKLGELIEKHAGSEAAIKVLSDIVLAGSLRDMR